MAVLNYIIVDGVNYTISDASAVPQTRKINNKILNSDVVLTYTDIGITLITNAEIDELMED